MMAWVVGVDHNVIVDGLSPLERSERKWPKVVGVDTTMLLWMDYPPGEK
jgi:hypothetical protein